MNQFQKILLYSFIGGLIALIGTYLLTGFGILHPYVMFEEILSKAEITYEYDFETFGPILKMWTAGALLPITGEYLFLTPFSAPSLIPLILLILICVVIGFQLKLPDGISASIMVLFMSMGISILLTIIVPHTLPVTGLSPSDTANLKGLTDELILLTLLTPPNWLLGSIVTFGSCVIAGILGAVVPQFILQRQSTSKSKPKSKSPKKSKTSKK